MFAVIETGGKQYRVEEGQILEVELLHLPDGEPVGFDRVLLVADDEEVRVGQPIVEGARVQATVLGTVKGPKAIIFKHSGRHTYRRRRGHRQRYSRLRVDSIQI